jgi:hypothetical protein
MNSEDPVKIKGRRLKGRQCTLNPFNRENRTSVFSMAKKS